MYIVGVDIAKRSHEATVIDSSGNTIRKAFNFRNDADGFRKLLSILEAVSTDPSDFIVGMESTSHYWLALFSNLQRRGYTVHVFNPIQSNALTGRTFGLLYVIDRAEDLKPGRPSWNCKCKCGNLVRISSTNLTKTNGTKSCGCLRRKESPTLIDLTGQRFGKLTVLRKDPINQGTKAKWICKCDCGNITSVLSESLRAGKSYSCGCNHRALKHDLIGKEYGHLLVLGISANPRYKSHEIRWKCKCQNCGRIVEVGSRALRMGNPYGHCRCTRMKKK